MFSTKISLKLAIFLFLLQFFPVLICFLWHLVNVFPNRFDRWKVQKCKANETCAIYFQPMNILSRLRVCWRQIEFDWLIDTPLHTRSEISFSKNTKVVSTLVRGKKMSASKKWQKKNLNNFGGDSHERSSIWGQKKTNTHLLLYRFCNFPTRTQRAIQRPTQTNKWTYV